MIERAIEVVIEVVIAAWCTDPQNTIPAVRGRSCNSNMLDGSTQHTNDFAIKLLYTLCMYMHRSTLVYIYYIYTHTYIYMYRYMYMYIY